MVDEDSTATRPSSRRSPPASTPSSSPAGHRRRAYCTTRRASDASMLVVGSTAKGPLGRVAPGATAERLLHGAPCPVAVAPMELAADWRLRRIGVGFLDVEEGHEALRAGAELARAAGGTLHAMTAVEPLEADRR